MILFIVPTFACSFSSGFDFQTTQLVIIPVCVHIVFIYFSFATENKLWENLKLPELFWDQQNEERFLLNRSDEVQNIDAKHKMFTGNFFTFAFASQA